MAFSCLLRSSVNLTRLHPSLGIASRFSPITTFTSQKLLASPPSNSQQLTVQKKLAVPVQGLGLTNAIRNISTTPAKWSSAGGDAGKLWTMEKYLSAALLGILPLGIAFPNILFDIIMSVSTVMHIHWGVEAIVVDYVRPIIFGSLIPKLSVMLIYVYSIFLLVGLLNLSLRGAGVSNSIRAFWNM